MLGGRVAWNVVTITPERQKNLDFSTSYYDSKQSLLVPKGSDIKSIDECRSIWQEVYGRRPSRFPMPVWMFERVAGYAGKDLPIMWRWLRAGTVPEDTAPTREIHPAARTVREWLEESPPAA